MTPAATGLVEQIDALLPQTQCRLCGYAGCRPYAVAIAAGHAGIDQCPPGGDEGARELAALVGAPFLARGPGAGFFDADAVDRARRQTQFAARAMARYHRVHQF